MVYRLSTVDIRLLHVFRAVVECSGFSNAQAVLNVGQPTISNHISQLENRLGMRLCDRGRAGFRLTAKGQRVYEEVVELFKAHEQFQNVTLELKGKLSGFLNIGVIDSIVTDDLCPVVRALDLFNQKSNEVIIRLEVLTPNDLERAVLDMDVDLAIGTFDHRLPGLEYRKIYVEHNELYCGSAHPIRALNSVEEIRAEVRRSRKVTRAYLEGADLFPLGRDDGIAHALVNRLEAAAILILGGGHIGFLPRHVAEKWVLSSEMHAILPDLYDYASDFFIVTRKSPRKSVILDTFLSDLEIATQEIIGPLQATA